MHTHAPYATAVSTLVGELPTVHYMAAALGGQVRVADYALYGSDELAAAVLRALGGGRAGCLMRNHGMVTFGDTLEQAYDRGAQLEWMCRVWLLARSATGCGTPSTLSRGRARPGRRPALAPTVSRPRNRPGRPRAPRPPAAGLRSVPGLGPVAGSSRGSSQTPSAVPSAPWVATHFRRGTPGSGQGSALRRAVPRQGREELRDKPGTGGRSGSRPAGQDGRAPPKAKITRAYAVAWPHARSGTHTGRTMRIRHAVAAAVTTAVGAGTAALAAGRYGSGFALKPAVAGPAPEGLVTVHRASPTEVVLTLTPSSARPGLHGLTGPGVHAAVGEVTARTKHSVTRALLRVDKGSLRARRLRPDHPAGVHRRPAHRARPGLPGSRRYPANSGRCPPGSCPATAGPG